MAHHAATGLDVTVVINGEPRPLSGAVDQAAYRILQEALTNAARHGTGDTHVRLDFARSALELDGHKPHARRAMRSPNGGHGLIGMRERAALLGGTLMPKREDDAFRVQRRAALRGAAEMTRVLIVDDDDLMRAGPRGRPLERPTHRRRRRGLDRPRGRRAGATPANPTSC